MSIDDALQQSIVRLTQQTELLVQNEIANAALAGIPFIGGSISTLMTDLARRRLVERTVELAEAMKERIAEIDESKIDVDFFKTEAFQTLFALAWEQLRTTHDREKLRSVASALVNSGVADSPPDDRKELFFRILRDLSMEHIESLRRMEPQAQFATASETFWPVREPVPSELAIYQVLAGYGLVTESLVSEGMKGVSPRYSSQWTASDAERALKELFERPPKRTFRISEFGREFLAFVSAV